MPDSPDTSALFLSMFERIVQWQESLTKILDRMVPAKPPARNPMCTPEEAAEILRVSVKRLAEWRSQRLGPPYYHVGKTVVYDPADIEEFLRSNKVIPMVLGKANNGLWTKAG